MTQNEKLQALFQKAAYHGWNDIPKYDKNMGQFYVSDEDGGYIVPSVIEIIFSHDFAKCLFGGITKCLCSRTRKMADRNPAFWADCECHHRWAKLDWWEHQLQQAVISEDPIGYMYGVVFTK